VEQLKRELLLKGSIRNSIPAAICARLVTGQDTDSMTLEPRGQARPEVIIGQLRFDLVAR
jgi:hypothetical protein